MVLTTSKGGGRLYTIINNGPARYFTYRFLLQNVNRYSLPCLYDEDGHKQISYAIPVYSREFSFFFRGISFRLFFYVKK